MQLGIHIIVEDVTTGKYEKVLLKEGRSEQWRSAVFDGEACYQGSEKGVKAQQRCVEEGVDAWELS